jgi:hypothetical protein
MRKRTPGELQLLKVHVSNLMSRNFYKSLIIKNFLTPIRIIPGKNNRIVECRNNCQKLITSMSGSRFF